MTPDYDPFEDLDADSWAELNRRNGHVPARTDVDDQLRRRVEALRIDREARRIVDDEEKADLDPLERRVAEALMDMAATEAAADHVDEMLTEEDIAKLPPIEWVIDGWWQSGGVGVIYGTPGIGKTLALIAVAKAVRRGARWFGRKAQRGAVLFYEGEGLHEFRDRFAAYNERWPADEPEALGWHRATGVDLTSVRSVAAVIRTGQALAEAAAEDGDDLKLVVIEPLIENMSGDENKEGTDAASRALRVIAHELDCCVLVGHHTNASSERERGSDKLRARMLTMARMEPLGSDDIGLVVDKQRSAPKLALELMKVESGPSVVLEHVQEISAETYAERKDRRTEAAKARKGRERAQVKTDEAMEVIRAYLRDNEGASERKVLRECRGQGAGEDRLRLALGEMVAKGDVIRTEVGNGSAHALAG